MARTSRKHKRIPVTKKLVRLLTKFFSFIGYPLYLIVESIIILLLVLFYQIGQLFIRRIPFFILFLFLAARIVILKIKKYSWKFLIFWKKPIIITPLYFLEKVKAKIAKIPRAGTKLTRRAEKIIPRHTTTAPLVIKRRTKVVGVALAGAFLLSFLFWWTILRDLPNPEDLVAKPRPLTTHILDRNGKLLFKIYRNQNRTNLNLAEIPNNLQQATIAIEDAEFYSHPGFSLRGIVRSAQRNIARGELTGGSTITQQLVKNALLSPEKTWGRKFKEIILAVFTEFKFTKKEILTMYLNEVSYGGAAYGVEEAAQLYFGKSARDLDLAQSTLLAGLPAAPTKFSPFGSDPDLARSRQKLVLDRMVQEGYISTNQAQTAENEPLTFALNVQEIRAPHFVMYVRQLLAEKYGERLVEEGGLTVTTTLDLDLQEKAQKIVSLEVGRLANLRVGNGAAMVTSPASGEILAMVGSTDYFNVKKSGNFNVTTASRQPGSSIKPVNYSYALAHGYTPATILQDTPVSYPQAGQTPYTPHNYDSKFRGNVTLRTALGSSLNVPAVKVLNSYGVVKMIEQGKKLGITTWDDPSRFGLSLTLGGGEVKMVDMAVVFGTLANYGQKVALNPILKITDSNGRVLEENKCQNNFQFTISNFQFIIPKALAAQSPDDNFACDDEQVLDPRIAFLITSILSDNNARLPVFGPRSLLVIPNHSEVAVKTGTTQNLRDNWAIGYTQNYVVLAWVGNNDNTPMSHVASGISGATPIWHNIMAELLRDATNHSWGKPAGIVEIPICSITGTLPCENCPVKREFFLEENQPKNYCKLAPKEENSPPPSPT
ncbi:transglycosylase domain-containing protein [Candidatus Microgenomates bacterium]|nr:transglycosylase domain-containing protein [Candidatus Microgenomates bacterium]